MSEFDIPEREETPLPAGMENIKDKFLTNLETEFQRNLKIQEEKLEKTFKEEKMGYLREKRRLIRLFKQHYKKDERFRFYIYDGVSAPDKFTQAAIDWFLDFLTEKNYTFKIRKGYFDSTILSECDKNMLNIEIS